jgi:hypothetical protein
MGYASVEDLYLKVTKDMETELKGSQLRLRPGEHQDFADCVFDPGGFRRHVDAVQRP